MTADGERILSVALKLPDADRAELGAILTDSVGDGSSEVENAWIAEAKRRLEEIRTGKSKPIPSEEVERELEELIAGADGPRRLAR